jgi:hypothetical protein
VLELAGYPSTNLAEGFQAFHADISSAVEQYPAEFAPPALPHVTLSYWLLKIASIWLPP